MCGIVGLLSSDSGEVTPELLRRMTNSLRHRGPDDEGYLLGNSAIGRYESRSGDDTIPGLKGMIKHLSAPADYKLDIALGHRRLSIIDLSAAGHQPMSNEEGTVWIVYNGEIYNYIELRQELRDRGHVFRSGTDTEIILHSYEEWGEECLNRFNGMWAFAIWDGRQRKLFCSRDRFGIKPFYYYFDGKRFVFASEIKAVVEADFIVRDPNNRTIFDYLAYGLQDCTENTFFNEVRQLKAGHYLEFLADETKLKELRYYEMPLGHKPAGPPGEGYTSRFGKLLENSIRMRLASDVPLGTCLSGGLDSSSIVCVIDKVMRETGLKLPGTGNLQKTFSARFNETGYDEGYFIDEVVKKAGVEAYNVYPTGESIWGNLPGLIWHQDEPCARPYVNSQWQVYGLARQSGVTVVLDGQGGDELLAGYGNYYAPLFSYLIRTFQWADLAREFRSHLNLNGQTAKRDMALAAYHLLPRYLKLRIRELAHPDGNTCLDRDFTASQIGYYYRARPGRRNNTDFFDEYLNEWFTHSSLPGLLRDLDKSSMAHSIESRPPFLDYRLVESAFSIPWEQKIHRAYRKYILRNAMKGILPESVANRVDKMGFPTPADIWFRGDLANQVAEILDSQSFKGRPFFNIGEVEHEFKAHRNGSKNIGGKIWRWINLELWFRVFIDKRTSFLI